jgi:hypothetical protein
MPMSAWRDCFVRRAPETATRFWVILEMIFFYQIMIIHSIQKNTMPKIMHGLQD